MSGHSELRVAKAGDTFVPSGMAVSVDGKTLYVAGGWGHALAAMSLTEPTAMQRLAFAKGSYPYTVLPAADGKHLYVSLWGKASVAVVDLEKFAVEDTWATEAHPTEMALSPQADRLFVACANSNQVTVLDTAGGRATETISTALYPKAPNGSTPNSLALGRQSAVCGECRQQQHRGVQHQ